MCEPLSRSVAAVIPSRRRAATPRIMMGCVCVLTCTRHGAVQCDAAGLRDLFGITRPGLRSTHNKTHTLLYGTELRPRKLRGT